MGIPNSIPHPHPLSGVMTLILSYLAPCILKLKSSARIVSEYFCTHVWGFVIILLLEFLGSLCPFSLLLALDWVFASTGVILLSTVRREVRYSELSATIGWTGLC